MNTSTQSEVLALARGDQKRLEQLAVLACRSPQSMLKFVLRDGFDAVEEDIRETLAAERDIELHGTVPHAEVMRGVRKIIGGGRTRKQDWRLDAVRHAHPQRIGCNQLGCDNGSGSVASNMREQ